MADDAPVHPSTIPLLYADGVLNLFNNKDVVKFYLTRSSPSVQSMVQEASSAIAQIVMPMRSFIETVAFFQVSAREMIERGVFSQEELNEAMKLQED